MKRFVDCFGVKNVCIVIKEDIDKNPKSELAKVYAFLGVNPEFTPAILSEKVSPGIIPRFVLLEFLRRQLFHILSNRVPRSVVYIRKLRLAEFYRKLNSDKRPERFRIEDEIIAELLSYYRDEVINLEMFLSRELDMWRK